MIYLLIIDIIHISHLVYKVKANIQIIKSPEKKLKP